MAIATPLCDACLAGLHAVHQQSTCITATTQPLHLSLTPLSILQEVHRAAKREQDNVAARNDRGGGRGPPGRGPPGAAYGEMPRRPGGVDHLRRDELPTAPMKAQLGARTASTEISLRPQGFGLKGASPMRGAGERRPAATAVGTRMAPEQPPPPARTAQQPSQQQQREPALQQQRSGEEESSAPDSGRPSEAGGAALSEVEVHGHVESIVKLLFGQTDDTGETPQELLRAVVSNAEDVGGALQQLLRQCLDVRGVPLEERLEKPKVGARKGLGEYRCLGSAESPAIKVLGRICQDYSCCSSRCRMVDHN